MRSFLVLLGSLALSLAFYTPPGGGFTYFGFGNDPLIYMWFLHWWPYAIGHGLPLFSTRLVDAPVGVGLAWKTGVPALALLVWPLGAVAGYNVLCVAAPALAGWGAYLAAVELTGDMAASVVAGLVFAGSSYGMAQQLDHLNLAFDAPVALAVWVGVAGARRHLGVWRLGVVSGLVLAFEFGVSQEVFAGEVLFGTLALSVVPGARRVAPGFLVGVGVCLILISPLLWEMLRHYGAANGEILPPVDFSTDMLNFVVPTPVEAVGGRVLSGVSARFVGDVAEQGAYFGLPLLALLGAVAWRRRGEAGFRAAGVVGVVAAVASLGPYVHVLGHVVSTAPWLALSGLPLLKAVLPARLMVFAWLAVAMFLAMWLAAPGVTWRRYAAVAGCLVFLAPARGVERHWTHLDVPAVFTDGVIPQGSRVMVLPLFGDEMGYQLAAAYRFSLVGQGYLSNGQPAPFADWGLYRDLFDGRLESVGPAAFAAYLRAYGVRDVVVVREHFTDYRDQPVDGAGVFEAGKGLLTAAGWVPVWAGEDAVMYAAGPGVRAQATGVIPGLSPVAKAGGGKQRAVVWVAGLSAAAVFLHGRRRPGRALAWAGAVFLFWIAVFPAYVWVIWRRLTSSRGYRRRAAVFPV